MRRLLSAPGRALRSIYHFIDPPLKIGRIPFGRTVLALQIVAAATFIGYTLVKKDVQLPFTPDPYLVDVIVPDAKGLNPSKEPAAGVAGAVAGKVIAVERLEGQAKVTLRLDEKYEGRIFNDAIASVRPTSVLQTLIVNIIPGNPETGPLADGEPITPGNTDAFVHIDELTSVLDADTQAQVQVLISEAARALRGREPELRKILLEVGELAEGAQPMADALADRRKLLRRLVDNLDELFTTLGLRGEQLARAIEMASRTLEVTAENEPEIAAATQDLAPVLAETRRALSATRGLSEPLIPALDALEPVVRELEPTARRLRHLNPKLDEFVELADRLVDDGKKPVRLFSKGLQGLDARVRDDQIPALRKLVDLVDLIYKYRNGFVQFAETWSAALSLNREAGTVTQLSLINVETTPSGFGFDPAAVRSRNGEPSRLALELGEMLEYTCHDNPAACAIRFNLPGLPEEPLANLGAGR